MMAWATDTGEAFRLARRALDAALSENLWPSAIDAIEAIAVLHCEAGRRDHAARLLGATTTARDATAYRYRDPHRTEYVTGAMSLVEDSDEYDAGRAMSRDEAAALATAG